MKSAGLDGKNGPRHAVTQHDSERGQRGVEECRQTGIGAPGAKEPGQGLRRERAITPQHVAIENLALTQPPGNLQVPALIGDE